MIAHVVLFEPRPGVDEQLREQFLASAAKAAAEILSIKRFRFGPRVRHHLPGYEQDMRDHYGFALIIEFEDVEGLKEYLQHPAHEALGEHFTLSTQRALAYDFDLQDLALRQGIKP